MLWKRMAKEGTKMSKLKHRQLAKRLVINGIEKYKEKFILEVDLLSGVDRLAMVKYKIPDLRMMFENDIRFLNQMK